MEQHMIRACKVVKERNIKIIPNPETKRRVRKVQPLDPQKETKKCDFCDERFTSEYRRRHHMRIHGDKYPCQFCVSSFAHPMGLSKHLSRIHPDKNKERNNGKICTLCDSILASSYGLKVHYETVHDTQMPSTSRKTGSGTTSNNSTNVRRPLPPPTTEDPL